MYVNPNIKNTERVFSRQGRYDYLRYDMNENPEGLPKDFVDSVLSQIPAEFLSVYPEPDRFIQKYAKYIGKRSEQILPTNGSDMAIRYLFEVFGEPGKDVVTVSPSFEMYRVYCNMFGLHHVPVNYDEDCAVDIDRIINNITEETCIAVLINPNNPTGDSFSAADAEKIIQRAQKMDALVIIDEAYHYFWNQSLIDFVDKYSNVVLLRTFSKFFSLAALRLGVIIGSKELIHFVKNAKLSFDVNSLALLFGEKLIDHPDLIKHLTDTWREGEQYLIDFLEQNDYRYRKCKGNFILIRTKQNSATVVRRLEDEKRILVHGFGDGLFHDYIRVSVGSVHSMQLFLNAFIEIDQR